MIPKIIHYCWFGGKELPELALHCIDSWKQFCPDYEIMRWDETNTDLNENTYIREAYENGKWAFVSDYIRLKALYEIGGIYMDTDVEIIKPLDEYLSERAFSGFENTKQIPTGIMASENNQPFFQKLLSYYEGRHFINPDGSLDMTTNVQIITTIALENGFIPNNRKQTICGMTFYPRDYFCPKDHSTGIISATENTVCIHHFDGSWHTDSEKKLIETERKFVRALGDKAGSFVFKFYKNIAHPSEIAKKIKRLK